MMSDLKIRKSFEIVVVACLFAMLVGQSTIMFALFSKSLGFGPLSDETFFPNSSKGFGTLKVEVVDVYVESQQIVVKLENTNTFPVRYVEVEIEYYEGGKLKKESFHSIDHFIPPDGSQQQIFTLKDISAEELGRENSSLKALCLSAHE